MQKYTRIASCLIALACKEAFKTGFEGFVCLRPKTLLKEYYIKKIRISIDKIISSQ